MEFGKVGGGTGRDKGLLTACIPCHNTRVVIALNITHFGKMTQDVLIFIDGIKI